MKDLDTSSWILQKQVEIRRSSGRGYFFDIIWVKPEVRRGDVLQGGWVVAETFGTRKMPFQRSIQGTV